MRGFSFGLLGTGTLLGTLLAIAPAQAQDRTQLNQDIAEMARIHKVPERLIHRIIVRESRYNARAMHAGNYGLMQIKPATARGMGYRGSPAGLLVAKTNLTYAVPYLANAYRVAGGNEDRAVQLYAGGYYYAAKRKGMLAKLTSAHTTGQVVVAEAAPQAAVATPAAPPVEAQAFAAPASPLDALASIFSPTPTPVAAAPEPTVQQTAAAEEPALEKQIPGKKKPRKRERQRRHEAKAIVTSSTAPASVPAAVLDPAAAVPSSR